MAMTFRALSTRLRTGGTRPLFSMFTRPFHQMKLDTSTTTFIMVMTAEKPLLPGHVLAAQLVDGKAYAVVNHTPGRAMVDTSGHTLLKKTGGGRLGDTLPDAVRQSQPRKYSGISADRQLPKRDISVHEPSAEAIEETLAHYIRLARTSADYGGVKLHLYTITGLPRMVIPNGLRAYQLVAAEGEAGTALEEGANCILAFTHTYNPLFDGETEEVRKIHTVEKKSRTWIDHLIFQLDRSTEVVGTDKAFERQRQAGLRLSKITVDLRAVFPDQEPLEAARAVLRYVNASSIAALRPNNDTNPQNVWGPE